MNRVELAEAYLTRNAELEAEVESLKRERDVLFKGDWAALNLRMQTAERERDSMAVTLRKALAASEATEAREAALRGVLNLALMHLEDERAIAAVRAALATPEDAPKVPHQGGYEPPEVDDWRPGDHRPKEGELQKFRERSPRLEGGD